MADDLKYGYKGAEPTQSFGNNTGVFDPNDINNLIADNKWTSFGQLELIETQNITTDSFVDFTSIQESTYNVHFLTFNNLKYTTDSRFLSLKFSNDSGSTFEGGTSYQYAMQRGDSGGTFGENKSTGTSIISYLAPPGNATNEKQNGYIYLYNLGDSSKYSFTTSHSFGFDTSTNAEFSFGSGVYTVAETINAIRLQDSSASTINTADISLYGIRYS
jgi:hypothetical protein